MTADARRAVIYARLSKDLAKTGAGVERQLEDARTLAKLRGFTVMAEHVDNDTSAAGAKRRSGFDAMLSDLTENKADVVIAWAWDRLSRNRRDTLQLIEAGQQHHVIVALVRGSDIDMTTASGRLVADLLAGVARAEIDAKSERQERAGLQSAEAGRPPSRRAFGYLRDGTPHPDEAPVVKEAFGLFLAGSTMSGLARSLNAKGHTSTRGKPWSDTAVRVVLTNPRYIGERYYRGQRVAVGQWPALVGVETFEAVKAKLADGVGSTRRPARKYLGGGLYKCHCGAYVKVSYDATGNRVYICQARRHMQRKADPVDAHVRAHVATRLKLANVGDLLASTGTTTDVADLHQKALAYRARLDSIASDYADGHLTARQVSVATAKVQENLSRIEQHLAEQGRTSALASLAGAPDLGDAWLALPLDRERAVLGALVEIVLLPGKVGRGGCSCVTVLDAWECPVPITARFDWLSQ